MIENIHMSEIKRKKKKNRINTHVHMNASEFDARTLTEKKHPFNCYK